MGLWSIKKNLNLATVVMHGAEVYSKHEWDWGRERLLPLLRGVAREEIPVWCRMINGSTHEKLHEIFFSGLLGPRTRKFCVAENWDC